MTIDMGTVSLTQWSTSYTASSIAGLDVCRAGVHPRMVSFLEEADFRTWDREVP
jgi:hypothetical protein